MNLEKAIKSLQNIIEYWTYKPTEIEAAKLAIAALEKQIPKKPLPENKYYYIGKCPSCCAVFLDNTTKYCGSCGQALDWSED